MAEPDVVNSEAPEGWYDDPAKPGMQRWWTGTDWTDHVRYSDTVRLSAVAPQPDEPVTVAPVRPTGWIAADTVEIPQLTLPTRATESIPDPSFDSFYVPMRYRPSVTSAPLAAPRRRSGRARAVWLTVVVVLGAAAAAIVVWMLISR